MTTLLLAADDPNSTYLFWGFVFGAAAFIILGLELFIPSGGLLGLLAAASVVASIVCFFMYGSTAGAVSVLTYIVLTPIIVVFGLRWWMNSPLARRFVLGASVGEQASRPTEAGEGDDDEASANTTPGAFAARTNASLRDLVGVRGEALTPLRPVGTVRIAGRRIDALAESGTIDAGSPIVVTDVHDNHVKVREA